MSGNLFAVFLLLVIVIFTIVFVYFYVKDMERRRQRVKKLREQGVTTTAEVLKRLRESSWKHDAEGHSRVVYDYYVIIDFKANDTSYQLKMSVSHKTYKNLEEGDQVEVVYLPDQPEVAMLANRL